MFLREFEWKLEPGLEGGLMAALDSPFVAFAVTLIVQGMNDVINSQGYTQSDWWNRIPLTAWALMVMFAIACNLLLGFGKHRTTWFFLVLPVIVSISFFLIADINSPRSGVIRILPKNLLVQRQSMKPE